MDPGNINKDVGGRFLKLGSVKSAAKGGGERNSWDPPPPFYMVIDIDWTSQTRIHDFYLFILR